MGTRSIIKFVENGATVCAIYQQFDGYLSCVGKKLADFCESGKLVNGIPVGEKGKFFNGVGCLAAQFIAENKDGAGGLYIYRADCEEQECNYEVHADRDDAYKPLPLRISYAAYGEKFTGSLAEFQDYIKSSIERETA